MQAGVRRRLDSERLLVVDPRADAFEDHCIGDLPDFLMAGDALVLNDAATLPASLHAGDDLELRLMSRFEDGSWLALTLGPGDHRVPTEARGAPPGLNPGMLLDFGQGLSARVLGVQPGAPRLVTIAFREQDAALWQALYRAARPIQYAHTQEPLALWDVQNGYAARPWAVELPSAGKPLSFGTLLRIAERGVQLTYVTHAAGLSSTGDASLDARLPVAERYEVSELAALRLRAVKAEGGRVIAVGTSVTRALESASRSGILRAGSEWTRLVLGPSFTRRSCDGLLTGLHEPGTSHFSLLESFAPRALLKRSLRHAERKGYTQHEFGDACLILAGALQARFGHTPANDAA